MGRFPLVTLRAHAEHDRVEAVMRAPLRGAGLGVPSFGISHYRYRVLSCSRSCASNPDDSPLRIASQAILPHEAGLRRATKNML